MAPSDNRQMLQPIDVIFRFLQNISFNLLNDYRSMIIVPLFSLIDSQGSRSDLAL